MANRLYKEEYIQNIADAIRLKNGTSNSYLVSEMADAIIDIKTGITIVDSGTCGDNITWELYEDGKLIISGSGVMTDYSTSNSPFSREDITSAVIEDGITTISKCAFYNCHNLVNIAIPDSITTIYGQAFRNCEKLASISIPDSVTTIGNFAFYNCVNLDSVVINSGLTTIGNYAFYLCDNLKTIIIPDSIISIGLNALNTSNFINIFYTGTKSQWDALSISSNTNFILCCKYEEPAVLIENGTCGENVAWELYSNGELIISGSGAIADYAFNESPFAYRDDITGVIIENGITSIGEFLMAYCYNIKYIAIPDSVTSIVGGAFMNCTSLTSVTIPDSVTTIGNGAFLSCSSLTSVTIGDGITSISNTAFNGCTNLTTINVPWAEGAVSNAPWGATNATINYNYQGGA